jgi:predicted Zn-dependent protease
MMENMAVALPVFLLESHYSRENETEADRYAFESMIQAGIDPVHFTRIMEKLSDYDEQGASQVETPDKTTGHKGVQKAENSPLKYLSTHPATLERIDQANYYSALFRKRRLDKTESVMLPESAGQ